ncbi:MAG: DUF1559 domain-containing protein [Pirellulales bacterium]|nr:DUF1559 domain-containing protein [Pirellulales bacterium]
MQFTLKTLLVLFVVLASSMAAFGPAGIMVTLFCVIIGVGFHVKRLGCAILAVIAIVLGIGLLLPAVSSIREAGRRACCMNNLKQVGLALHCYYKTHGCFPPAYVTDANGKRLHGWRSLLLAHMEETSLHSVCHYDEPWNAPSNRALASPITSFGCPSVKNNDGRHTSYLAVTGPGTAWPGERGSTLDEFTDGPSNTILLVEVADSGIPWAEPRDVTLDEALGPAGGKTSVPRSNHFSQGSYFIRSVPIGGHVLMADGCVRAIPGRLSREDLAALLSIYGGEKIDLDEMFDRYEPPLVESLRWDHIVALTMFLISTVWFWFRMAADARIRQEATREDGKGGKGKERV